MQLLFNLYRPVPLKLVNASGRSLFTLGHLNCLKIVCMLLKML
jgi:hypothetical protein